MIEQPKRVQLPAVTISSRVPQDVADRQAEYPLLSPLWVSAAGYFPHASGHITERAPETVDFYLLIYCLVGKGWFQGGEASWSVGPGELIVARPGVGHGYGADAVDPWTIQYAHFNGTDAAALLALADISPQGAVLAVGPQLALSTAFNDLLTALQGGYSIHHLLLGAACLRQILSRVAFIQTFSPSPRTGLDVQQVIDFMVANIDRRCTLDELAAQADMPRSTFARAFREKTGYAPVDYFLRLKIQKACELLETNTLQIGQVGRRLGYSDQYYFSRLFKKFMRLSPQQYRRRL